MAKTTTTVEGKQVSVGDMVGFKSDLEQYGIILEILPGRFGNSDQLKLAPAHGQFEGEYLDPDQPFTTEPADRCWV